MGSLRVQVLRASVPATDESYQGKRPRRKHTSGMHLRVVAVATNIPGPLAAARLVKLGAEVVKVEPPHGDPLEAAAPAWYAELTAGMRVERLDLRCSESRMLAHLANADLLITTLRPKALDAAHLDWPRLHAAFPRLCHVAVVGEAGEHADRAGHDLTYQARAGLLSPPAMPRAVAADMFAAERVFSAALEALLERDRTGEGTRHEIAIAESAAVLADAARHGLTTPSGPLGGALPYYGLYRASDGWIALAALEPHFQQRLREALGVDANDRDALAARFAEHSCVYWEETAEQYDLPIAALPHGASAR